MEKIWVWGNGIEQWYAVQVCDATTPPLALWLVSKKQTHQRMGCKGKKEKLGVVVLK
jgi:hypothetical protein